MRGQAEGIHTAPRFVAKSGTGETMSTRTWDDGTELGHDGALEHIVAFVREQLQGLSLAGLGHRVVHGGLAYAAAGARRRHACWRTWSSSSRSRRCTSRTT